VQGGWIKAVRERVRAYFVAGILAFAPLGITIWAISWIIQRLDNMLLPRVLNWIGLEDPPRLPFVGALFTFVVILLMGVIARHLFGGQFVRAWERLLSRVPVAGNIYAGVKQLFEAIFQRSETRFNRVVLIEYPRKGIYAIAFTTGAARGIVQRMTEKHMINCFLPTTPNPTSGFYLLVPEEDIHEVDLTVEDAFKLVMSAGLVTPGERGQQLSLPIADPAAAPDPAISPAPSPK
jgi:uncharacterized membrane protein